MADALQSEAAGVEPASRMEPHPLMHLEDDTPVAAPVERAPCLGETRFINHSERERSRTAREREGYVSVCLEAVAAGARGRLAEVIDEAIERELLARGAASPGIGSIADADAALSDQLFRARRTGARGVLLSIGSLRALTCNGRPVTGCRGEWSTLGGGLDAEDSATLRFWARATRERPIVLLLDPDNSTMDAYGDPMPLSSLLSFSPTVPTPAAAPVPIAVTPRLDPVVEPVAGAVAVSVSVVADPPAPPAPVLAPPAPVLAPAPVPARQRVSTSVAAPDEAWRQWVLAITHARGPQPLAAFERLFAQSYMPLTRAIADGLDDARALQAHDEFRHNFEKAYSEACPTFAVTGKRPKMVLDAPEIAARLARLHGARSSQLILVDGMRFDLGALVKEQLVRALGTRATLTDDGILWSALPTTTSRQLDLLARGMDAFRAPAESETGNEPDPLRGRTAETIRRVKVGHRDVYKLDLVESKLFELTGSGVHAEDIRAIADVAAEPIARHAGTLPARTLLYVFGDHGFTIDRNGAVSRGGAAPESVLVPAFAFLSGSLH